MSVARSLSGYRGADHVTAVIVTHSRPVELRQVLDALAGQSRPPDRIVVVDNASTFDVLAVVDDAHGVEVLTLGTNGGGAGGFAAGMELALRGPTGWLWLMDDDAIPRTDALRAALDQTRALMNTPDVKTGALFSTVYEFGAIARAHRRRGLGFFDAPASLEAYENLLFEIDTGSFVGALICAPAALDVGLPRADFFLSFDDTEYSLRLKRAGYRNFLAPRSEFDHLRNPEGRLRNGVFGARHYYSVRNAIVVAKLYADNRFVGVLKAIGFGAALWAICGWPAQLRLSNRNSASLLFRAVRDGIFNRMGAVR